MASARSAWSCRGSSSVDRRSRPISASRANGVPAPPARPPWSSRRQPRSRITCGSRAATVVRRSALRALAIYLVVLVSAVAVLAGAVFVLASVGRRLLGDPIVEQFSSLQREIGTPLITVIVFGVIWIFYRRVVSAEAAREA